MVIHVIGGVVVTTLLATTILESAHLPGQQNSARVQLIATWSPDDPPLPPVLMEVVKPKIVLPERVLVTKQNYRESLSEVSQPMVDPLAMSELRPG